MVGGFMLCGNGWGLSGRYHGWHVDALRSWMESAWTLSWSGHGFLNVWDRMEFEWTLSLLGLLGHRWMLRADGAGLLPPTPPPLQVRHCRHSRCFQGLTGRKVWDRLHSNNNNHNQGWVPLDAPKHRAIQETHVTGTVVSAQRGSTKNCVLVHAYGHPLHAGAW